MKERCLFVHRLLRVDHGAQWVIVDVHLSGAVLSNVRGIGADDGNGLSNIADAVLGQRPMLHRHLDTNREGFRQPGDVLPGYHGVDARHGEGAARADRDDAGMR